jgi:signal transduction histidine kinase/DNA-binding response OmpR family regulator
MATLFQKLTKLLRVSSVRTILIIPFVIQIVAAVGVTGYLSFHNAQEAVNDLVVQLESEVTARVEQRLNTYLTAPLQVIRNNAEAPRLELIDLNNPSALGHYFWQQLHQFASVDWIYFANEHGGIVTVGHIAGDEYRISTSEGFVRGRLYQYAIDSQGHPTQLLRIIPEFDPRLRGWYKSAVSAGRPIWSDIYSGALDPILAISMAQPVHDQAGKLQGVMGLDLTLGKISEFLQSVKIGRSGYVYIIERSGLIVASSSTEAPFTVDPQTRAEQRLLAVNSRVPLINASVRHMMARFGDLASIDGKQNINFMLEDTRHYTQILPYKDEFGLDWLIVVVVPESDFMSRINANTHTTIALMVFALCVAIAAGTLTAQWVVQPILSLNAAAKAMAAQDWAQVADEPVATRTPSRADEVGQLARSFSSMASQLRASFATLEVRVLERTNELAERTQQLEAQTMELIKAKDQAEVANAAKSIFLATMSHELRTPLNGILGFAHILQQRVGPESPLLDGLATIEQSGEHLLALINDILDLSRVEAGKLDLTPTDIHLPTFLAAIVTLMRMRAEAKALRFVYQPDPALPPVILADELRLRQILLNLLGNALKFTDRGQVTLSVRTEGRGQRTESSNDLLSPQSSVRVRFAVEDTGPGIPADELARIFQPFEQGGDLTRHEGGVGLGLAISRQLVRAMGGDIQVQSVVGQGSSFWFTISVPVLDTLLAAPAARVVTGYAGPRRSVLVVDDIAADRALLVKLLTELGFTIYQAANGQEGIDQAQAHQPDLILMDCAMPLLDGRAATRRLHQLAAFQHTPIIAISASVAGQDQAANLAAGASAFVAKPIAQAELLEQIGRLLRLEWLYAPAGLAHSDAAPRQVGLPPGEARQLYELARQGLILELRERLEALERHEPRYQASVAELRQLARRYRLREIRAVLEPYMQEASRDSPASEQPTDHPAG